MSDTQLIKEKIDVVDLIGEYVQLKPAGINHKGLCPFHGEKTPSFMVSRERQSWHCFGCNKGGDIFTFVQEMEGMDFSEALKYLAGRAGVQLTKSFQNEAQSSQKNRIKDINQAAAHFFYNFLNKMPAAVPARDYLQNRGMTQETIDEWQVGFVPEQWDLLTQYLLKKGYAIDDLVASGLTIKKDGTSGTAGRGFYDRFRGRIMFPICDVHGSVVGFTGRILVETDKSGGKYVNTPQTVVFDKSRVVFGLDKAKKEIRSKDLIVMVEGQMDVIACHQASMKNVVATSGTALTEQQIKLLKRYSDNISIAFDADEAGEKAAKRGIDLAIAGGMNVKIIQIPEGQGKDPDEVLKTHPEVWFDAVKNARGIMEWQFERAFAGRNIGNPKDKQTIADILLAEIGHIPFAVERDHWLQELSRKLSVDSQILRDDMERVNAEYKTKKVALQSQSHTRTSAQIQDTEKNAVDVVVEKFLSLVLFKPALVLANYWLSYPLSTGYYAELYEMIKKEYTEKRNIDITIVREFCAKEHSENIADVLLLKAEKDFFAFGDKELKQELEFLAQRIKSEYSKKRRGEIQLAISKAEAEGNDDAVKKLLQELKEF